MLMDPPNSEADLMNTNTQNTSTFGTFLILPTSASHSYTCIYLNIGTAYYLAIIFPKHLIHSHSNVIYEQNYICNLINNIFG